jgi:multidrug resistance efflux pump
MPKLDKKRWLAFATLGLVVAALVLIRSRRPVEAVFTTVRPAAAVDTVLATGRVVGEKTIPLSFVRPGRIAEEFIQDGDDVGAGQVLLTQEKDQAETGRAARRNALAKLALERLGTVDVKDAEQRVRQTRAAALYAEDYLKRQEQLFKENSIPSLQVDQARRDRELAAANYEAAQNQLEAVLGPQRRLAELQVARAETDLRQAEIDLRETALRAPFDGRIVGHDAHKGEYVGAGQTVVRFIPAAPRSYVEIQVDETNSGKLALGQKAVVVSSRSPASPILPPWTGSPRSSTRSGGRSRSGSP